MRKARESGWDDCTRTERSRALAPVNIGPPHRHRRASAFTPEGKDRHRTTSLRRSQQLTSRSWTHHDDRGGSTRCSDSQRRSSSGARCTTSGVVVCHSDVKQQRHSYRSDHPLDSYGLPGLATSSCKLFDKIRPDHSPRVSTAFSPRSQNRHASKRALDLHLDCTRQLAIGSRPFPSSIYRSRPSLQQAPECAHRARQSKP